MVSMKKSLLFIFLMLTALALQAQKDTTYSFRNLSSRSFVRENTNPNVSIYPVPVRYNTFSIKTDKEMKLVKVTNMIGQDIFRAQYRNPQSFTKVMLENPQRGMYLVTIAFNDGSRIVKKIMIENPD
jgi:hypothetical protein